MESCESVLHCLENRIQNALFLDIFMSEPTTAFSDFTVNENKWFKCNRTIYCAENLAANKFI